MKNILKNYLAIIFFIGCFFTLNAQSVSITESTLYPIPLGLIPDGDNTGVGCFTFIESSGIDVPAESFPGIANVTMSMDLQFLELTNNDLGEVTGSILDYFTLSYDQASSILTFTQNAIIPADWSGNICVGFTVIQDSTMANPINGFNVNIAATDTNTDATGNEAIFTYTSAQYGDLTLTKNQVSISGTGSINDVITYSIIVQNTGNTTLSNVTVTDNNAVLEPPFTNPIAEMKPGTSVIIEATQVIIQDDIDAGFIEGSASATGTSIVGVITDVSDTGTDPNGNPISNNENVETPDGDDTINADPTDDPTVTSLFQNNNLTVTKSQASVSGTGTEDDIITYLITIENTGNTTLTDVLLTDSNAVIDPAVVNPIAAMLPGDVVTIEATHTITQSDIDVSYVENSAVASGESPFGAPISDISDTDTDTDGSPIVDNENTETANGDGSTNGNPTDDPTVTIFSGDDDDGDGIPNVFEPTTSLDPCLPVQNPGYTGYNPDNLIWQQGNCDGDNFSNAAEVTLGTDPYDVRNKISGTVLYDQNDNGCDINDNPYSFISITIDDGTNVQNTFSNATGAYRVNTLDGNFTVTPNLEHPTLFNVDPIDATINFPDVNNNVATQDFCISRNGIQNDLEIVIAPLTPARPGFDAIYLITYKNKGNTTLSGDYSLTYDDTVLDYLSATVNPATQTPGLLTWDYQDLAPFESRSVYVTFNVNGPTETPPVNIGDELDFTVTINPIADDLTPDDNIFEYTQIVVGSYDPNDITCLEGEFEDNTEIGDYLHYIINFENTGDFYAENVVVITEVDPTMFDISTLQILSSSHDPVIEIEGNQVRIVFQSIQLDTGGHGNILLKLRTLDDLEENSTVTKHAEIFFDYNFPIETNDANTTFQTLLGNTEFEIDDSIKLHPNPVKNVLTISASNTINTVTLIDLQGRLLYNTTVNNNTLELDVASRANGVYFVKITTDNRVYVKRVIKE